MNLFAEELWGPPGIRFLTVKFDTGRSVQTIRIDLGAHIPGFTPKALIVTNGGALPISVRGDA